jgi:hypothetical protein
MKRVLEDPSTPTVPAEAVFALPRPSRALTALTTSALALPGIAGSARADAPIEEATAAGS